MRANSETVKTTIKNTAVPEGDDDVVVDDGMSTVLLPVLLPGMMMVSAVFSLLRYQVVNGQ